MSAPEFSPKVTSGPAQPVLEGMIVGPSPAGARIAEATDVFVIAPEQTEQDPEASVAVLPESKHYTPRHSSGMRVRFERNRPEPRHAAMRQPLAYAAFNLLRRRRNTAELVSHVALSSVEKTNEIAGVELASHA